MTAAPAIVWFRNDLRLADNPALAAAAKSGAPVMPIFILDDAAAGSWARGGASRWWLHHSLASLDASLRDKGLRLTLRRGAAGEIVRELVDQTEAAAVFWNRRYEPWSIDQDTAIKAALKNVGSKCESFNAALLYEPWEVSTQAGDPYKVFTPFWRACQQTRAPAEPVRVPGKLAAPDKWPASDGLDDWDLLPCKPDWAGGLREAWTPGEAAAKQRLRLFLDSRIAHYKAERDVPGVDATSRLSPWLHFGEIGPRQIWQAVMSQEGGRGDAARTKFLSELGWREFSYHLLFHFPHITDTPLRDAFAEFPWRDDPDGLRAWQKGLTGYPIVDAGMRQLWQTGWMHNRVRMIVASFLIKDLLIPWQQGERWFWDTLVDADLANNSASWQWVAGCGADAAPYFRVFNPVTQGEKFDPAGAYVREFVPEVADLPDKFVHAPWTAPDDVLSSANVVLGTSYPRPIVDHAEARRRALAAFDSIKKS